MTDVLLEPSLAQANPAAHRSLCDVEDLADLPAGEPFEEVQLGDDLHLEGQPPQGMSDELALPLLLDDVEGRRIEINHGNILDGDVPLGSPAIAVVLEQDVAGNAIDEGRERGPTLEARHLLEAPDVGLLNEVLDQISVRGLAREESLDAWEIAVEQRLGCTSVALLPSRQQCGVIIIRHEGDASTDEPGWRAS